MTIRYWPIRYVDNPFKGEGRNIGFIACGEGKTFFEYIGGPDDKLAERYFATLSRKAKENAWVFREWIEWFKYLASQYADDPDEMEKQLIKLDDAGAPFIIGKEGQVEVPTDEPKWIWINEIFYMLVGRIQIGKKASFDYLVEETLRYSEVIFRKGFERDIEVVFTPANAAPVSVFLPFALVEGKKTAFKLVRFSAQGDSLSKQVNDAVYTFDTLVEHGFAQRERCITLIDQPTQSKSSYLEQLKLAGNVVDITEKNSNIKLHSLTTNNRK